jgi:hypothetical protein
VAQWHPIPPARDLGRRRTELTFDALSVARDANIAANIGAETRHTPPASDRAAVRDDAKVTHLGPAAPNPVLFVLWGQTRNLLPDVISEFSESAGRATNATRSRWEAGAAAHEIVEIARIIELPSVPRAGDEIYAEPFSEGMLVEKVHWLPDAGPGSPAVRLVLAEADGATVESQGNRIDALIAAAWTLD